MCIQCDIDRQYVAEMTIKNPQPCIVCKSPDIVGVATWIADEKHALAVGAVNGDRIFGFCLCAAHNIVTEDNEGLIVKAIVRTIRDGNSREVK